MGVVFQGLGSICGLAAFVCFIMVLVKMFQNGQTTMGIISIVTACCGIGHIIALVVGWQNADRWMIRNLMMVYTVCFIGAIVLGAIGQATGGQLMVIQQR